MAGDQKYAKSMIRGICSHYPDYALIVVDAKRGLNQVAIEHFKLAFAFNVPVIVVVTKIDLVDKDHLADVVEDIRKMIKDVGNKIKIIPKDEDSVVLCSRVVQEENICPIFLVSNKTRKGLDLLQLMLNLLPINNNMQ